MPIMPQYRSPYGQSIAELLMRQGEIAARGAERSGQIWGNAVQNLGQIGAQAYEQHREQKDQQKRQLGISTALSSWDGKDLGKLYRSTVPYTQSPQDAMRLVQSVVAFQELGVKQDERNQERLGVALGGIDLLPDEDFLKAYPALRQKAQAAGFDVGQFPEQADVKLKPVLSRMGMALRGEKPTDRGPENPENVVINGQATVATPSEIARAKAQGMTVAPYNAPKEEKKYQVTVPGAKGPVTKLVSESEMAGGIQEYQKPLVGDQPSYQAKEVLNDEGKPVMANFNAKSGQYVEVATGKPIQNPKPVPSAAETQDSRKFQQAGPVLSAVSELSERINTLKGVYAKAQGEAAKAAAKVNLNDDVAEYEALVSGFTPLVARALGHTGVLTQQDVDSVRNLFPTPGDSKTLRDRKVKRMNGIIKVLQGGAPEETTGGAPTKEYTFNPKTGKLE